MAELDLVSAGLDIFLLSIIVLSTLLSLKRGLLREALSLGAWLLAGLVAAVGGERLAAELVPYMPVASVRLVGAVGGLVLATLIIAGVVNIIIARNVQYTGLSAGDRLLGTVFGLLRGGLIVVLLVILGGFTPLTTTPVWQASRVIAPLQVLNREALKVFPSAVPAPAVAVEDGTGPVPDSQ